MFSLSLSLSLYLYLCCNLFWTSWIWSRPSHPNLFIWGFRLCNGSHQAHSWWQSLLPSCAFWLCFCVKLIVNCSYSFCGDTFLYLRRSPYVSVALFCDICAHHFSGLRRVIDRQLQYNFTWSDLSVPTVLSVGYFIALIPVRAASFVLELVTTSYLSFLPFGVKTHATVATPMSPWIQQFVTHYFVSSWNGLYWLTFVLRSVLHVLRVQWF
jgi:hypothetical protein